MIKDKTMRSTADLLPYFAFIRNKKQEHFVCLSLDSGMRVIRRRVVTIGLLDRVMAHPREVFAGAIKDHAAYVVVAHNHPSGNTQPSDHDIALTQQLVAAGQIIGIALHDHIIMTKTSYYNFGEHLL